MKVGDLISKLKGYNPNLEIVVFNGEEDVSLVDVDLTQMSYAQGAWELDSSGQDVVTFII